MIYADGSLKSYVIIFIDTIVKVFILRVPEDGGGGRKIAMGSASMLDWPSHLFNSPVVQFW